MNIKSLIAAKGGSQLLQVAVIATAAVGGVSLVSSSVFASLSATAFNNTGQDINTHTVLLSYADAGNGFSTSIGKMLPGDVQNRFVTLNQVGTGDATNLTLQAADSVGSDLTNGNNTSSRGLQVQIDECSVAWNTSTGACSGTTTAVMAKKPFSQIGNTALGASALSVSSLAGGSKNYLRFAISLEGTEEAQNATLPSPTIQGKTATVTWTFREDQATGSSTNS